MTPLLESIFNLTLDRPPQEWIAGIVIALFLALGLVGANALLRRWVKVTDESVPLVGLAVVAIFAGMFIAGTHTALESKGIVRPGAGGGGPGPGPGQGQGQGGGPGGGNRGGGYGRTTRMAALVFDNADADHDGVLSIDEAANAAAKFVHDVQADGSRKLDQAALLDIIRERTGGAGGGPPPAASPPPSTAKTPAKTAPASRPPS